MANNNQRMITMPDGKQYPLMPQPTPNPYAGRAAAQEAVQQQQPVAYTTANPDVQAFAQGKAAANTTPNLFRTPVTEPYIRAAINKPTVIQRNNTTPQEHKQNFVQERQQEQQQNNKPITSMEELARAMGYTSQEDEDNLRKASMTNRRILAVADALRHIGNIANTVGYAPVQQFNNPVLEEQARYEKGKALRDRANQQYLAYQQAKAKQDAEQRRWEQQFNYNQSKDERNYKFNAAKAAADLAERQRQYDETAKFNREKQKANEKRWERQDKETRRHHGAVEANTRAGLAETIRHHKEIEANGGTSKGNFPVKSPYGKMHVPGRSIPQAQMNQAYKDFETAGWIKQDEFKKRMAELGVGAKADPDYVRNRIVEEVIAENGEASDYMRDNFNWQYENDTRGTGAMLMREENKPQPMFQTAWGGGQFAGENPYSQYMRANSSSSNVTDYSQYIRK
jgi:hypothetical protein